MPSALEQGVADQAVGDDDVGGALEEVAALDVADVVEVGRGLEQVAGLFDDAGALALFAADVHEGHARLLDAEHVAGQFVGHDAVLPEVLGLGLGVGAGVDEHERPVEDRHGDGDAGADDAGQAAHVQHRGGDAGAVLPAESTTSQRRGWPSAPSLCMTTMEESGLPLTPLAALSPISMTSGACTISMRGSAGSMPFSASRSAMSCCGPTSTSVSPRERSGRAATQPFRMRRARGRRP